MWKYIVTYIIITELSFLKFSGDSEPMIAGIKVPKSTFYVELAFDTIRQETIFKDRRGAVEFSRIMDGYSAFKDDSVYIHFENFKLDSIKVKK